jgi:hypothetical protein
MRLNRLNLLNPTVVLLGLAVALGLYLAAVENPRERSKQDAREREGRVVTLKEDEITALEFITGTGRVALKRGETGSWRLTAPVVAEADDGAVRRVLSQLATLSVVRAIEGLADPAAVGLATPAVRVVVRHGTADTTLEFGDANPSGSGVYVRRGDQRIFLTTAGAKSTFELSTDDVRRKEFLDFDPQAVTAIAITTPGRVLRLERGEEGWTFGERHRRADPDLVSSLMSRLRALRATAFFDTPDQRAAVRLATSPRAELELTTGSEPVRLAFYDAREGAPGGVYVRTAPETLYRVNEALLHELPLDAPALRDMHVVRITAPAVTAIEVVLPAGTYRVARTAGGWEVDGRPLTADAASRIEALLQRVSTLKGDSIVSESVSAVPAAGSKQPAARLQLFGAGDRLLATLTIGARDGQRRYAYSGSEGPVFLVTEDVLTEIPEKATLAPDGHVSG